MSKIEKLRQAILAADNIEADQLVTYISDGHIEYRETSLKYKATVVVGLLDWKGDFNRVSKALGDYLINHEPGAEFEALRFDVDVLSQELCDVRFTLPFTDMVIFEGDEYKSCDKPIDDLANLLPVGKPQ